LKTFETALNSHILRITPELILQKQMLCFVCDLIVSFPFKISLGKTFNSAIQQFTCFQIASPHLNVRSSLRCPLSAQLKLWN